MLARRGLKQKESLFNNKFSNILGLVLNLLVIGFVLISGVNFLDYWRQMNKSEALSKEMLYQALEELRVYEERKNNENSSLQSIETNQWQTPNIPHNHLP